MNNTRIEKKFVLGKSKEDYLESILIRSGFNRIFKPRYINSIYLDTVNYDFVKDNINGVSQRKKIRFRWYNNDLNNISLEEKNKNNFSVNKIISKVDVPSNSKNLISNLKSYFYDLKKNCLSKNYLFILKTNYFRSYWLSHDKKIRATIDINLNASPINNLISKLTLNDTILEFKFLSEEEENFRNLFHIKKINLRSKKYSKYLQSFHLLEESGLI
tara:strand:+ start:98 stop:745 length:648 start_codon:yes stop_codon:yes gene_type:complete